MKKIQDSLPRCPDTAPDDEIALLGLRFETRIGVYPEERTAPRPLEADVRLRIDLAAAGRSDALADTVDYAALADRLRTLAADASFRLLEALAEAFAAEALRDARVVSADVALRKPGAVPGATVEVRIRRSRPR